MPVDFSIGGMNIRVTCSHRRQREFLGRFLNGFSLAHDLTESPDLEVDLRNAKPKFSNSIPGAVSWGTEVYKRGDSIRIVAHARAGIICEVEARKLERTVRILCYPELSLLRRLLAWLDRPTMRSKQLWMTMAREGIMLPALAELMVRRSVVVLHASIVADQGKAIAFTGLNGCGKSGLAMHLMNKHAYRFLTDNFGIVDTEEQTALMFPEPLRLHPDAFNEHDTLYQECDVVFGKIQKNISPHLIAKSAQLVVIAQVVIGERFSFEKITDMKSFSNELEAFHSYLGETPESSWVQLYYWLEHEVHLSQLVRERFDKLTQRVACYRLVIPRAACSNSRYSEVAGWVNEELQRL